MTDTMEYLKLPSYLPAIAGIGEALKPPSYLSTIAGMGEALKPPSYLAAIAGIGEALKPPSYLSTIAGTGEALKPPPHLSAIAGMGEALKPPSYLPAIAGIGKAFKMPSYLSAIAGMEEALKPPPYLSPISHMEEVLKPSSYLSTLDNIEEALKPPSYLSSLDSFQESSEPNSEQDDNASLDASPGPIAVLRPAGGKFLVELEFNYSIDEPPVPRAIEANDPDAIFDPQLRTLFCMFEQRLRQFVANSLFELAGPNWIKHRVPYSMRERWNERQEKARNDDRPVYEEVQYSDFMDLHDIIVRNDNWQEVFRVTFRDRDYISVSLRRLHLVRIELAHNRPLSRIDVMDLVTETERIFNRLNVLVLH